MMLTILAATHTLSKSIAAPSSSLDLRVSCGAVGDGLHDDGGALRDCQQRLQALIDQGLPAVLRVPAGIYLMGLGAGQLPTLTGGAAIIGDGPHQSHFVLSNDFAGDLFSWSEAWTGTNFGPPTYDVRRDKTGAEIIGRQITGTKDARNKQNALVFYDRNDHVLIRDVEVDYLNGACLVIGRRKAIEVAYMRESAFYNLKCYETGTPTQAAVEITSSTGNNSDATNELDFFKLAIFGSSSSGLEVRNPNAASATRKIRFFGLRIEKTGSDCFDLGSDGDQGVIAEIDTYDFTAISCAGYAFRVFHAPQIAQPYQINISGGSIGPGNSKGIYIESGWNIALNLSHVDAGINIPSDSARRLIRVAHDGRTD
jgi:hypothetical protein